MLAKAAVYTRWSQGEAKDLFSREPKAAFSLPESVRGLGTRLGEGAKRLGTGAKEMMFGRESEHPGGMSPSTRLQEVDRLMTPTLGQDAWNTAKLPFQAAGDNPYVTGSGAAGGAAVGLHSLWQNLHGGDVEQFRRGLQSTLGKDDPLGLKLSDEARKAMNELRSNPDSAREFLRAQPNKLRDWFKTNIPSVADRIPSLQTRSAPYARPSVASAAKNGLGAFVSSAPGGRLSPELASLSSVLAGSKFKGQTVQDAMRLGGGLGASKWLRRGAAVGIPAAAVGLILSYLQGSQNQEQAKQLLQPYAKQ